MLHACLYTICFVFCYTSWCFYAFSRTNLLMRCHGASSLFSAIFMFQKSYIGNMLGIGRNKSQTCFFPEASRSLKMRRRGPEASLTLGWRGPGPGRATRGWDQLVHLLTPPFRLYIPLDGKTLKPNQFSLKHTASRHRRRREIGRIQELFPAPCRRGNPCRRPSPPPWSPLEWCVSSLPWTTGP
jgi:hypothetical protein